jgi:hypothetical protein
MEEAATITGITTTSSEMEVSFSGPFSWAGTPDAPSIYEVPEGQMKGVYLWTVPLEHGHLIYYVGDTGRTFAVRMDEHYTQHAAANYHVYSMPNLLAARSTCCGPVAMTKIGGRLSSASRTTRS